MLLKKKKKKLLSSPKKKKGQGFPARKYCIQGKVSISESDQLTQI